MENIKFIKEVARYTDRQNVIIGDCLYYNLENGNKIKMWCYDRGVMAEVINKTTGKLDCVELPFRNYFEPKQCSPGAPKWSPYIYDGKWYFSDLYNHVVPNDNDYMCLAAALETYIGMYE